MPATTDVSELVAQAAQDVPDRIAVVEGGGRRLTWRQLEDEAAALATGLGRDRVHAGHRVMIAVGNRAEFVTAWLGALRAQAVAVPVNPRSTRDELARMLTDSGSRVVVADAGALPAVREAVIDVEGAGHEPPVVYAVAAEPQGAERPFATLLAEPARPVPPLPDPEKLAALLYTSGTSGRPRAAMLTHRALLANAAQVARVDPPMFRGDDVVLGVLPLFHVYGLGGVLGGVLRHRATLLLVESWEPGAVLDLVDAHACTVLPLTPTALGHWLRAEDLDERFGSVRLVLSGSAPLAPQAAADFTARTGLPVHQGYGLTEAAPVVTSTLCSARLRPGSVGAALPGVELRLVDESGRAPESGDPGRIQVRGANLFSGYWPDGADGPATDGWWETGDVGLLDAEGDLFLVDRVRELIIVSGFNVYPLEVEEVIREVPEVVDAAVIGVEDPLTGEAVVAYVVARDGADVAEAVRAHTATRLARFKLPARVEVVEELPLTVTGKVQKGRLRGLERRRALGLLE